MEVHQNNEQNGQQAEAIADAQANNEHMEGDYNAEPIEHPNLYEEIIEPQITIHDDAAPFELAPTDEGPVYGPPTYSEVLEKQRGNRIDLQEEQDQFAVRPGTGNQNVNPDIPINDQNPDAGNRSPVRVLPERDQLLPDWRHMEARLEEAVQNLNLVDPIDHDRVAEEGLRRSSRVPLYSEKYMQYRSSIRAGNETDDDEESFDEAMAALQSMMTSHDPVTTYNPTSALLLEPYIPISYKDATSCSESKKWILAIEDEFSSIMENKTWTVVPLPPGRKAIKCKWVLDYKPGHRGVDPRYKARLVACGYSQLYGVDYLATYSPVVKHYSIRVVLGIVAAFDLEMIQLDVKTAFLYGKLIENIYMRQPEGYVLPGREEEVCKLKKPLYGLKQASNCWNLEFNTFLLKFGFKRAKSDSCVYFRITSDGEYTILIIYVDDGLACSNRPHVLSAILDYLREHFQVRSLPPTRFVGLDITRDRSNRTLSISQPDFIHRLLQRYNMVECNPVDIPADPNNPVTAEMSPKTEQERRNMQKTPVREAIGSLMYLMAMTRGDIAYAVNQVAAFVSDPGQGHWNAIKTILAYLSGTAHHGICFGGKGISDKSILVGFTDADFAADIVKRKSTTGMVFLFFGGAVSWGSKRQRSTALSTADSEFYAASEGSRDAIWFKALLDELGIDVGTITMYCDNASARSIIEDPENHRRSKHIAVHYFFVRDQQELGTIKMTKVSSHDNVADMFTKALPKRAFLRHRNGIGIREVKQ
jgi:hypothetical protein